MFTELPDEIREQIWSWVCRDEAVDVLCKHGCDDFQIIDTRDTLSVRLFTRERARRLIYEHAILNFDKIRSIETLKRAFHGASGRSLRPFRRVRLGYYGLFCVLRSVTAGPFDRVDELQLQCCTRYWPPVEPEVVLCDDDEDVRDIGFNYDGRDGPLLLTRYCMARLQIADDAVVRLVRCFVGRDGYEKPTGVTFQVKILARK